MSVHTRALPTSFRQLTLKAIRAIVDMPFVLTIRKVH
jgi:hypothetical protein